MNAFQKVLQAAQQAEELERQRKAAAQQEHERLLAWRDQVIVEWFNTILTELGIDVTATSKTIKIDGMEISIRIRDQRTYYPLIRNDEGEWRVVDGMDANLLIKNIALDQQYKARRPDMNQPYVGSWVEIHVDGVFRTVKWDAVRIDFGQAIAHLLAEAEAAPARKAEIDAKHEAAQARLAEERRQEEERKAQLHARWAEDDARLEAMEREAREEEARLRAEVAQRFEVSPEGFDYLIEALAKELRRSYRDE